MNVSYFSRLAGRHLLPTGPFVLLSFLAVGGCERPDTAATQEQAPAAQTQPVLHDTAGHTDNSACMVCHMDLADEPIAAKHLEAEIVCASCHGASEAHGGDELNVTTPDVTYGRAEIVPFCETCHPTHKTGEKYDAFVKKWHGKRRPNGRMILDDSVCTDCHGNHAI